MSLSEAAGLLLDQLEKNSGLMMPRTMSMPNPATMAPPAVGPIGLNTGAPAPPTAGGLNMGSTSPIALGRNMGGGLPGGSGGGMLGRVRSSLGGGAPAIPPPAPLPGPSAGGLNMGAPAKPSAGGLNMGGPSTMSPAKGAGGGIFGAAKGLSKKSSSDVDLTGAYQADRGARVHELDRSIEAESYNRKHHPFRYWLDPFVPGPLTEMTDRANRRLQASRATSPAMAVTSELAPLNPLSLLGAPVAVAMGGKDRRQSARDLYEQHASLYEDANRRGDEVGADSEQAIDEYIRGKRAAAVGAQTANQAAEVAAQDHALGATEFNRRNHPYQYWLNPFVRGPINEIMAAWRQRQAATRTAYPGLAYLGPISSTIADTGADALFDSDIAGEVAGATVDAGVGLAEGVHGDASKRRKARQISSKVGKGSKSAAYQLGRLLRALES